MVRKKPSSSPSSAGSDLSDDPDTEEALKGFDFLASPDELDGPAESRSGEDSAEWGETHFLSLFTKTVTRRPPQFKQTPSVSTVA